MVVKQKIGRKRYIAFEIVSSSDKLTRGMLARSIDELQDELGTNEKFDVILISGNKGIILTNHRNAAPLTKLLNSFTEDSYGFELKTLRTSGTIKTLKQIYFLPGRV